MRKQSILQLGGFTKSRPEILSLRSFLLKKRREGQEVHTTVQRGAQLSAASGTKGGPERTAGENPEHRAAPDVHSSSAEFSRKIPDLFEHFPSTRLRRSTSRPHPQPVCGDPALSRGPACGALPGNQGKPFASGVCVLTYFPTQINYKGVYSIFY